MNPVEAFQWRQKLLEYFFLESTENSTENQVNLNILELLLTLALHSHPHSTHGAPFSKICELICGVAKKIFLGSETLYSFWVKTD